MVRTRPWELSEEVWERAAPLLPAPNFQLSEDGTRRASER